MSTPGQIGRYRIDGVLGRGGMGVVYEAWDPDLQRKVAVKVLRDAAGGAGRVRLLREARAMARLSHPNVLPVFEVGSHDGRDFIAIEMIDGTNLADWLRDDRTRAEILRVFGDAGRGLAAAHAAGMIHRDFKPHNVLVRRDGRVVVTDFGLVREELAEPTRREPPARPTPPPTHEVRAADETAGDTQLTGDALAQAPTQADASPGSGELTEAGAIMGTFGYMAPEQYAGRADARSDQFAYCVALWEALAGAPPFAAATHEGMVDAIERGPRGEVHGRLRKILARGLAADPARRWPSMDALLRELEPPRRLVWWLGGAAVAIPAATAAIVLATMRAPARPAPLEVLPKGEIRHLTMVDGCEEFPSFTPDGKTIVFDGMVGSGYAVEALDVDSGQVRQLTPGQVWEYKPSVSPDGTRVAFIRADPGHAATYVMPLAGGSADRIGIGDLQPFWDPGGRAVWLGSSEVMELVDVASHAVVRTIKAPEHTHANEGVALPDGRIAVILFPSDGEGVGVGVTLFDRDGTAKTLYSGSVIETIALTHAADALLVTRLTVSGTRELLRVPLDGSPAAVVPGDVQPTVGMAITPRGDRIAWSSCTPSTTLAKLAGTPLTATTMNAGDWTDAAASAIPGTHQLLVLSDRDGTMRPWLLDLDHRQPPRSLPFPSGPTTLAVSRDAKTAYVVDDHNQLNALALDASQPPRVIASHVTGTPSPRADGSIAVMIDDHAIAIVPAAGGEPKQILDHALFPCAAPSGEDLYYATVSTDGHRVVMHRDAAGAARPLTREPPANLRGIVISEDGKRLALVGMSQLVVVDASTGQALARHDAGAAMLLGATWSGSSLVISRADFQGDLWLLQQKP